MSGIAFKAIPTDTFNRPIDELKNEVINLKSTQETEKTDLSYKTNENSNLVAFNDPVSNKLAIVSLDYATLNKLKSHFGDSDFFSRNDGITRLNDEAESFVGGWFADIAYKREFLNADKNQDGNLDSGEYLNTKNDFNGHAVEDFIKGKVIWSHESIDENYQYVKSKTKGSVSYAVNKENIPNCLDDELNDTLKNDKNFDGIVVLKESYGVSSSISNKSMIESHIDEYRKTHPNYGYGKKNIDIELEILLRELEKKEDEKDSDTLSKAIDMKIIKEITTTQQESEKSDIKNKVLLKLEINSANTSKLTQDEKKLIDKEIYKLTDENGNIDVNQLEEIINYIETTKIYKEEDKLQKIGKYYEDRG